MRKLQHRNSCFVGDNDELRRQIRKLAEDNNIWDASYSHTARVSPDGKRYDYLGMYGGELRACDGENEQVLSHEEFMDGLRYYGLYVHHKVSFKNLFADKPDSAIISAEKGIVHCYGLAPSQVKYCLEELERLQVALKAVEKANSKTDKQKYRAEKAACAVKQAQA